VPTDAEPGGVPTDAEPDGATVHTGVPDGSSGEASAVV